MLTEKEIAEERCVTHLGVKVKTRDGFADVTHVCKTIPLPAWEIKTTRHALVCAHDHLIMAGDDSEACYPAKRLVPGNTVVTVDGVDTVVASYDLNETREFYDLKVDNECHTYFTGGILSHNSTGIGGSIIYKLETMKARKSLYIAPLQEQVKTFADRLQDMHRGSIFSPAGRSSNGLRSNLYYKESPMLGSTRLMHLLTDPSKVRGISVDDVIIDEAQDFDSSHMEELVQVQKASSTPTGIIAGTSKELETFLETHYQAGSRGVWYIRGGKPGLWYSLNDPETLDRIITVRGLRCPETGRMLNPFHGQFVHEDARRLLEGFPSFHLPQIIVPDYASGSKWLEIWTAFSKWPRHKFLKEVMGIPVSSGHREINEDDLKRMCDPNLTFAKIRDELASGKRSYRYIVSGCDWGGSDYNPATKTKLSYTVHAMIGITHDGNFDLLHAHRYAEMPYQDIAAHIVSNHNKLNGFAIAADNGVGQYYNAYMRDCGAIRSDRLILFQYNDVKDYMSRIENPLFNLYSLNRTDSISALFAEIKAPKLRLRCPRWDESAPYLLDFLNSIRVVTERPDGRGILRYVKPGSKADDFMQAINFAVNLARVILRDDLLPSQQLVDEMSYTMQLGGYGYGGPGPFSGMLGEYFSG